MYEILHMYNILHMCYMLNGIGGPILWAVSQCYGDKGNPQPLPCICSDYPFKANSESTLDQVYCHSPSSLVGLSPSLQYELADTVSDTPLRHVFLDATAPAPAYDVDSILSIFVRIIQLGSQHIVIH
jgi:hypothetical protein